VGGGRVSTSAVDAKQRGEERGNLATAALEDIAVILEDAKALLEERRSMGLRDKAAEDLECWSSILTIVLLFLEKVTKSVTRCQL